MNIQPNLPFYVVQVQKEDGPLQVGPFQHKFQARNWLLEHTGSPTGGLPMLVLPPPSKDKKAPQWTL